MTDAVPVTQHSGPTDNMPVMLRKSQRARIRSLVPTFASS